MLFLHLLGGTFDGTLPMQLDGLAPPWGAAYGEVEDQVGGRPMDDVRAVVVLWVYASIGVGIALGRLIRGR